MTLHLDRDAGRLWRADGRVLDPLVRSWVPGPGQRAGEAVTPEEAVAWLQRASGARCRVPIGVIGARRAGPEHLLAAERVGERLAGLGLGVVCGGREGVMEAVCRGVARGGGLSVGLLPDETPEAANPHVSIPIATGLGIARNAIIARAALCLVAIGGGHGTLSEAALGLQLGKRVLVLLDGPGISGARPCADVEETIRAVACTVLSLPP